VKGLLMFACLVPALASGDVLDGLVVASAAADLITTERALSRPGLYEGNPLMQTPGARVGVKAVATAVVLLGCREMDRREHHGWSRGLRLAVVLAWSGAAVNNALRTRAGGHR
jgi:hypothetical protein